MLPQEQGRGPTGLATWSVALLLPLGFLSLQAGADSCIWYADDDTIRQVQTSTNQVTRVVPLRNPHRLVMNAADCGVWTLDKENRRLLRYNPEGVLELELRVRSLDHRLDEVERLQLDPYDESLWIADERRLAHVSPSGQLLGRFTAPGEVRRMAVALDRSLWVLGKRELWRFDAQGTMLASYTLGRHLASDARYFMVDSLGGLIWLADDDELAQLTPSNPEAPPLRIRLRHDITGLALDPLTGNVWVAQKEALLGYSRTGALTYTVDLEALHLRKPEKLAFDPVSRSLWAGAERSVARFTEAGQFVTRFSAKDGDEALGVPAFKVEPTLTLVRPAENALTNNPLLPFTLGYGAQCNGQACPFANEYFSAYQLSATLNGQPIGSQFAFDTNTAQANFTPTARLPEGVNTFSAQAKDGFGHRSSTISIAFAVDTVAPRFITLSPANGSTFRSPQVTLQGSVDDPKATVVLENSAVFGNVGPDPQGRDFAFPITLKPGLNTVALTALDPAGNAANAILQLTFVPVSVTIESPANGGSVAADSVLVSGTFQGPPNTGIAVNGIVAVMDANRFYAQVPLQPGNNVLNAVATSPDGATATQGITVTSTETAPISIAASPIYGVAPFTAIFELANTTGRTIKQIQADYNGDGTVDFTTTNPNAILEFTYTTHGLHTARFTITDDQNTSYIFSTIVQAEDAARLDQVLRATWGSMASALMRGDKAQALQFLNPQAREKYGPVFSALMSSMPQILASFSNLKTVTIDGNVGEYAINRMIDGVNRIFVIYLLRDTDGVWRVDSM